MRDVRFHVRRPIETILTDVPPYANGGEPFLTVVATTQLDVLTDGTFIGKLGASAGFAYERHFGGTGPILFGKGSAAFQRDLHHSKIIRRDGIGIDERSLRVVGAMPVLHMKTAPIETSQRQRTDHRNAVDSGSGAQTFHHLVVETESGLGLLIPRAVYICA